MSGLKCIGVSLVSSSGVGGHVKQTSKVKISKASRGSECVQ